jgi:hypothetical protein
MKYEKVTIGLKNDEVIKRTNDDGTESWIPMAEDNSDYQAYLNKDKAEQSTPIMIDEAKTK